MSRPGKWFAMEPPAGVATYPIKTRRENVATSANRTSM